MKDMKAMARPFLALYAMALVIALLGRIGLAVAGDTGVLAFDYISASGVPVLDVICSRPASRFACRRPARCSTARWPREMALAQRRARKALMQTLLRALPVLRKPMSRELLQMRMGVRQCAPVR